MKRIAAAALVIPALVVVAGLYVILFTPDVVTAETVYKHSHVVGVSLALVGLMIALIMGLMIVLLDE